MRVFNTAESVETENLSRLFDRFYRSDASRNSETGGYGIGLSIAKAVAQAHKGKISASSEDGNSFTVVVVL
ncbi:ATP-binding protein [Zhenpiania hominis]|uniref:ATP-binding protein n=1 Tax=Zhenpiania hominis TaxID=2763644 RepID=UPI0039F477ED